MRKDERQQFLDIISEKNTTIGELREELLEVYTCLYPKWKDIIKQCKTSNIDPKKLNFIVDSAVLDLIRGYHKEQLEK